MNKRSVLIGWRLGFGLLSLFALGVQLTIHVQNKFSVINFFSYFTNLSNIFAAIVLIIGAWYLLKRRQPGAVYDIIRGASVVAIAIVGIVYGLLLRNEDLGSLLPWINVVIHYIIPVVVVLGWLYAPPKTKLTSKHILFWLIYPSVYVVYSIIRGARTGWYAYPFFNPDKVGGAGAVALYCAAILVTFLVFSWLLIRVSQKNKRLKN
jgi:hypothetical protein